MKNTLSTTALLIAGSFIFFSCGNPAKEEQKEENIQVQNAKPSAIEKLPDAAIPIIYKSHLYIKSKLDSFEGYFVFDSGADRLYIDSSFYQAGNFQHENVAVAKLPGVGNKMQTLPLVLDKIEFSFLNQQIETIQTPIIQLKPILGDLADGIIGNQLLAGKIMEINYKKEYIIIHDAIDSIDLTGYSMIKCEKIKNRLYIPLELNIDGTVVIKDKFLLDLGSGGSLSLTSPAAQERNLGQKIKEKA